MVLLVLLFGFVECLCHWFAATGVSLVFGFCLDGGVWLVAGGWLLGFMLCGFAPVGFGRMLVLWFLLFIYVGGCTLWM